MLYHAAVPRMAYGIKKIPQQYAFDKCKILPQRRHRSYKRGGSVGLYMQYNEGITMRLVQNRACATRGTIPAYLEKSLSGRFGA